MKRICYLCGRKSSKSKKISLHSFPKNPDVRKKWLDACGLCETDDLPNICLCTLHFSEEDLIPNEVVLNIRLKPGSIPSIQVPHPPVADVICKIVNDAFEKTDDEIIDEPAFVDVNEIHNIIAGTEADNEQELTKNSDISDGSVVLTDVIIEQQKNSTTPPHECPDHRNQYIEIEHNYGRVAPKRRCFEPRYLSEIEVSDFENPQLAVRILRLIAYNDEKKSEQIRQLESQCRSLQKRLAQLQAEYAQLKRDKNSLENYY